MHICTGLQISLFKLSFPCVGRLHQTLAKLKLKEELRKKEAIHEEMKAAEEMERRKKEADAKAQRLKEEEAKAQRLLAAKAAKPVPKPLLGITVSR